MKQIKNFLTHYEFGLFMGILVVVAVLPSVMVSILAASARLIRG